MIYSLKSPIKENNQENRRKQFWYQIKENNFDTNKIDSEFDFKYVMQILDKLDDK